MALKEQFWSKKELALFKKLYPSDIPLEDLLKKFPNRSASSLAHKASRLNIKKGKYIPKTRTSRKWTVGELKLVRKYYGKVEETVLKEMLPGRSIASIKSIALKCRTETKRRTFSRNPSWSEHEIELLLQNYKTMSTDELMDVIVGRSYDAIRGQMGVMGLRRDRENLKREKSNWMWTDEEISILKANRNKSVSELEKLLPVRSKHGIRKKLQQLAAE